MTNKLPNLSDKSTWFPAFNWISALISISIGIACTLLAMAITVGGKLGDYFAFGFLGLLFSIAVLALCLKGDSTWKRMLAEPQLFAIAATFCSIAVSVSISSAKILADSNTTEAPTKEDSKDQSSLPPKSNHSNYGPPSYVLLILAPMMGAGAALMILMYNTRRWHNELMSVLRETVSSDKISQEVQFRSLCQQYPVVHAYLNVDYWSVFVDQNKLGGAFKDRKFTEFCVFISPRNDAISKDVIKWCADRKVNSLPQPITPQLLPFNPPLSAIFFSDSSGNVLHAILISYHAADHGLGRWISFGNKDVAGQLRESYRSTFGQSIHPVGATNREWIARIASEGTNRFDDRWGLLSREFALLSYTKMSVRRRLGELASDTSVKSILAVDQTDFASWQLDSFLQTYLEHQKNKHVFRIFVINSASQLTTRNDPGGMSIGENLSRIIKIQRDKGFRIGVMFMDDSNSQQNKNLDFALFLREDVSEEDFSKLPEEEFVRKCRDANPVLFGDSGVGGRPGMAEAGRFEANTSNIEGTIISFFRQWRSKSFCKLPFENANKAVTDGRTPEALADAILSFYIGGVRSSEGNVANMGPF